MNATDRNEIEELFTGECDPEPNEEELLEQERRVSGPSFAESQARLARALDGLTALAVNQRLRR